MAGYTEVCQSIEKNPYSPDNNNPAWHWDNAADYDMPANRYFVERIGGAVTGDRPLKLVRPC